MKERSGSPEEKRKILKKDDWRQCKDDLPPVLAPSGLSPVAVVSV